MRLDIRAYPIELDIYLSAYDGPAWAVAPFRHREGWLMISEARLMTSFGEFRAALVAAVSDQGEYYWPQVAARLLDIPTSLPRDAGCQPPPELDAAMDAAYWDFLGSTDLECLRQLGDAQDAVDAKIRVFEHDCAIFEAKLWATIRALRAERRQFGISDARRTEIDARLVRYLDLPDELAIGMRRKTAGMRKETEGLERSIFDGLTQEGEVEHHSIVHWRARSDAPRHGEIRLSSPRLAGLTLHPWQSGLSGKTLERVAAMRILNSEWNEE